MNYCPENSSKTQIMFSPLDTENGKLTALYHSVCVLEEFTGNVEKAPQLIIMFIPVSSMREDIPDMEVTQSAAVALLCPHNPRALLWFCEHTL